ncbi:MAG: Invasin [Acidimicrobiaceae bacterium]|nr:Invasin [Acidimicrobiaceae bacterium]
MSPRPEAVGGRRRARIGVRALLFAGGFVLAGATAAMAYWTVSVIYGNPNYALAQANSLSAATTPTATVNGSGAITVGWSLPASQLPGTHYQVTRTSGPGSPAPVCTVASTSTSCQDSNLTAGTAYSYSVAASLASWKSSSIAVSATTATPTFAITLSPSPYTAGTAISVTKVQATIGASVDSTYTGTKTISWSGLANSPSGQAPSYPSSSVTFTNGVANPGSTFTAYAAGTNTLTATDANATTVTGSSTFTVTFGPATKIVLSGGTSLASASNETLTATIEDAAGNTVTTGADATRSVTFAQPSGSGSVTGLGSSTASGGIASKVVTGNVAGTANLQASATLTQGATTSNTLAVTVTFGPATKIVLSGGTSLASASNETLTATIEDAAGNAVTTGADASPSVSFTEPTGSGSVTGLGSSTAAGGIAQLSVTGNVAGTANLQANATLTRGSTTSNTLAVTVTFGPATKIVLSGSTSPLGSGAPRTVTATIEDAAGNTVTAGADSSRSITFAQPTGTGSVTGLGSSPATGGIATKVVTGNAVGSVTLQASAPLTQGTTTSGTIAFTVNPAPTITSPTVGSPENPGHGGTATFTMSGTNFESGLTVTGNGSATVNSFTWTSSTTISVNVTGKGGSGASGSFTVTNPDGGTVTSANGSFTNG